MALKEKEINHFILSGNGLGICIETTLTYNEIIDFCFSKSSAFVKVIRKEGNNNRRALRLSDINEVIPTSAPSGQDKIFLIEGEK